MELHHTTAVHSIHFCLIWQNPASLLLALCQMKCRNPQNRIHICYCTNHSKTTFVSVAGFNNSMCGVIYLLQIQCVQYNCCRRSATMQHLVYIVYIIHIFFWFFSGNLRLPWEPNALLLKKTPANRKTTTQKLNIYESFISKCVWRVVKLYLQLYVRANICECHVKSQCTYRFLYTLCRICLSSCGALSSWGHHRTFLFLRLRRDG